MGGRHIARVLIAVALVSGGFAGCANGPLQTFSGSLTSYQGSSAFSPTGYSERDISETQVQVSANGTDATPRARLEKIATARAAEIGIERKLDFFKVEAVSYSAVCSKKRETYRATIPAVRRPQAVLSVVYAKRPPAGDTSFAVSQETFERLKAELAAEFASPESAATAKAEIDAQCGT